LQVGNLIAASGPMIRVEVDGFGKSLHADILSGRSAATRSFAVLNESELQEL
jgi:hypothetical protein